MVIKGDHKTAPNVFIHITPQYSLPHSQNSVFYNKPLAAQKADVKGYILSPGSLMWLQFLLRYIPLNSMDRNIFKLKRLFIPINQGNIH